MRWFPVAFLTKGALLRHGQHSNSQPYVISPQAKPLHHGTTNKGVCIGRVSPHNLIAIANCITHSISSVVESRTSSEFLPAEPTSMRSLVVLFDYSLLIVNRSGFKQTVPAL